MVLDHGLVVHKRAVRTAQIPQDRARLGLLDDGVSRGDFTFLELDLVSRRAADGQRFVQHHPAPDE